MVDDVGSPELEHIWLFGVLGLGCLLVNLGILDNTRLAILLQDQAHGLGGIALPHHLRSNVDVLGGSKTNEDRVRNLDQTVVNAVGVNVLHSTAAHVLTHSRGNESLVDTTISIRRDGSLHT